MIPRCITMTAHVVSLRKFWYARRFASQLTYILQDNFSLATVFLNESVNLDVFVCELPHIADIAKVAAKYDNAESTGFLVFAEVKGEVSGRQ